MKLILLLLFTGVRVSELCNIKSKYIDFLTGHLKVLGEGGKSLTFGYENGKLKTITDQLNRTITYNYDSLGNLQEVIDTGNNKTIYNYNSYGITTITDGNNKVFIENQYDEFGRVIRQYDEERNEIRYDYDDIDRVNTYTFVSTGKNISYYYNDKLYITKKVFDDGTYEEYTYDGWGNKVSIRDKNGNITNYLYDQRGNLLKVTSPAPFNYETSYEYDTDYNLTKVTSAPSGAITEFNYDTKGNLLKNIIKIDDTTNLETTYTYDVNGRVETISDLTGKLITYQYENHKYPVKIIEKVSDIETNEVSYTYDAIGRKETVTTEYGTTTLHYNDIDKIIKIVDASGNITRMKYDNEGNLIKLIKPEQYNEVTDDGIGTTFEYDGMDRLLREIDPLGNTLAKKYDAEGNVIKQINPNYYNPSTDDGTGIGYEYDKTGRLVKIVNPSGEKSRIVYDGVGNQTKVINANNYSESTDSGQGVQYEYDSLNRLTKVIDTEGNVIAKLIYDSMGNVTKSIDGKGYLSEIDDNSRYGTTYKYNLVGWLLEERVPVKEENGTIYYNISRYSYDNSGKLLEEKKSPEIEVTNEEGNVVQKNIYDINGLKIKTIDGKGYLSATNDNDRYGIEYTYDIGNRIKTITTPESEKIGKVSVEYTYNAMGNILTYKDGEGNTTTYERDLWGNATKIIDGEGIETNYSYDYAGNLISSTDGENNTTTYTYNTINLLSSITDPLGQTITYKYDKEGRLRQEIDRNGQTILYDYNRDNNLVSKRMSDGSLEERYLYNKDGSLLAAINSSGIETFEYTFNGYIKNKSRNGQNILSYEYNKNGSVEAVVDQTGARTEYIYDTLGRMQTVKDGTQEIASYNYNIDNTISQVNYNTGINISYQYDKDKNIENLISKDPQNNIIKELEYSYYNNGNVKTKIENGSTTAYTYDKADRLKIENNPTAGLIVYTYDNAHNMLSKKVGEDETTYSYDVNNRLLQSTNNSVITDYTYDNNGNILREEKGTEYTNYIYDGFNKLKEVNKSNGSWMYNEYSALGLRIATEENGVRAEFAFDRGSIITEVDSNNELIARSIRGLDIIAQKDNRNVLSYYLHNAHGDVTNLVDGNGQVLNSYEYDAFGNTLNYAEKVANRFRYAGEQFDRTTGHYYLRARYYAPNIARFTQEDTYRGDGLNLYGYVSNNPVRYVDPSGNCKDRVFETRSSIDTNGALIAASLAPAYSPELIGIPGTDVLGDILNDLKNSGTALLNGVSKVPAWAGGIMTGLVIFFTPTKVGETEED